MKKLMFVWMLAIILALPLVFASTNPILKASLVKYEPYPAEPGDYVDVWIKLENDADYDAEDTVVEFLKSFPFSLDPGVDPVTNMGIIGSRDDYVIKYTLKVSEEAVEGTNKLKIRFNPEPALYSWKEKELEIEVQTNLPIIAVTSTKVDPAELIPGEPANLMLDIENMGQSFLKDISVKLDIYSAVTQTATAFGTSTSVATDLPFAPHESSIEKRVPMLSAGKTKELVFKIKPYPDAESKIYKIPIVLTYTDNVGTVHTRTEVVSLIVNSEPDLSMKIESTTLSTKQKTGDISFEIVNKGLSDVKFANVVLADTDDYDLLSPSAEVYIGNIDSDDYETAEFRVALKKEGGDVI